MGLPSVDRRREIRRAVGPRWRTGQRDAKEAALAEMAPSPTRSPCFAPWPIEAEAEKDAESAKAVLETTAVIKQLSGDSASAQEVQELAGWWTTTW